MPFSLPDLLIWDDDLTFRNKIHCHYMLGLGYLGLGITEKAKFYLSEASKMDTNQQKVKSHVVFMVNFYETVIVKYKK